MITLGGDAELELVDSLDPFSEGVVFSVRPPKKSWKNIANLSGGEKVSSKYISFNYLALDSGRAIFTFWFSNTSCPTFFRLLAHWLLYLHSITTNLPHFM